MAHIQIPEANMKSQMWEFVFCNPSIPTVSQEAETGHTFSGSLRASQPAVCDKLVEAKDILTRHKTEGENQLPKKLS